MKSLFEVEGYDRFKKKKMTVSVYGVRTTENKIINPDSVAEFLVYYNNTWMWSSCNCYVPIDNKHGDEK